MKIQSFKSKHLVQSLLLAGMLSAIAPSVALAQQSDTMPMQMPMPMDHSKMPGMNKDGTMKKDEKKVQKKDTGGAMPMDHSKMPGMGNGPMPGMSSDGAMKMDMGKDAAMPMDHSKMPGMDNGSMPGMGKDGAMQMDMGKGGEMKMDMGAMQGGKAPADARDPDVYADGLTLGPMQGMEMSDKIPYSQVLIDRLEWTRSKDGSGQAIDAQAWFGGDIDKLWLKLDGERSGGKLGATRMEALWNHAISTYWSLQTGIRHDRGDGPSRNWAAFGVQGLAPYWFELQATAYVGQGGRTAARIDAEYDVLLTQKLRLQPNFKAEFYGRDDAERGIGSGLSDVEAGLRLRYEITRKVAPYIGVVWKKSLGRTADIARAAGKDTSENQVVAGVRLWF